MEKNRLSRVRIHAKDDILKEIVKQEIEKYGLNADLNHIDVSQVTDMSNLFHYSKFNGDISQWDVSKVTNMRHMFAHSAFNGDISCWNTENVEDMAYMFEHASFNQNISQWNVSNVTNMSYMFSFSDFNQDISRWNTGNVERMTGMFYFTNAFNQYIGNWDTKNVLDMSYMFFNSLFNQDLSKWDMRKVMFLDQMFLYSDFNQDISSWQLDKLEKAQFFIELDAFDYYECLLNFIKQKNKKDAEKIFNSFFIFDPKEYLDQKSKEKFEKIINFGKQLLKLNIDFIHYIAYLSNNYPFFCCEYFYDNKNLEEVMEAMFKKYCKEEEELFFAPAVNNLDVLLFLIIKKPDLDFDEKELELIFAYPLKNLSIISMILDKMEFLLSLSNKSVEECTLIYYVIGKFFDLEKKLIQEKNQIYLRYLNHIKSQFSEFYHYYSAKEKYELIKLLNDNQVKLCEEEAIDI